MRAENQLVISGHQELACFALLCVVKKRFPNVVRFAPLDAEGPESVQNDPFSHADRFDDVPKHQAKNHLRERKNPVHIPRHFRNESRPVHSGASLLLEGRFHLAEAQVQIV